MSRDKDKAIINIAALQKLDQPTELETGLGITQEYNSVNRNKLWDSTADKTAHKDAVFGQKATYRDPVTGTLLHRHQSAAKRKYGSKHWSAHATETDHIIPLKQLHKRFKYNPFLSNDDLKEIANRKRNYREISKRFNASKGKRSDVVIALDPQTGLPIKGRARLLAENVAAEADISLIATLKTGRNIGKIAVEGAKNALSASAIPLVVRGTQNLMKMANGEMTAKEAAEDLGTLGVSIAASGGATRLASFALGPALEKSSNKVLKYIAEANQIGTLLVISSIVARAAGKYLDGEIDALGFVNEIGKDGLSLAGGVIASVGVSALPLTGMAAMAAPVLAAMAASAFCSEVWDQLILWFNLNDFTYEDLKLQCRRMNEALDQYLVQLESIDYASYELELREIREINGILTDVGAGTAQIYQYFSNHGIDIQFHSFEEFDQKMQEDDFVLEI